MVSNHYQRSLLSTIPKSKTQNNDNNNKNCLKASESWQDSEGRLGQHPKENGGLAFRIALLWVHFLGLGGSS